MNVWEEIKKWIAHLWTDHIEKDIAALATAEVEYAKENFTPDLLVAAKMGYNAAEGSNAKGLDKTKIAAETAKNYLGERSGQYLFGAIVSAIQAVWKQEQINQAADEKADNAAGS